MATGDPHYFEFFKIPMEDVYKRQAYTFVADPNQRSYNVETPEGKELPYEDLYTMEDVYKRQR